MKKTPKSTIKRAPKRGIYNSKEIYRLLDQHYLCHVGFIQNEAPVVIPTMYG